MTSYPRNSIRCCQWGGLYTSIKKTPKDQFNQWWFGGRGWWFTVAYQLHPPTWTAFFSVSQAVPLKTYILSGWIVKHDLGQLSFSGTIANHEVAMCICFDESYIDNHYSQRWAVFQCSRASNLWVQPTEASHTIDSWIVSSGISPEMRRILYRKNSSMYICTNEFSNKSPI